MENSNSPPIDTKKIGKNYVVKRDGTKEDILLDKITERLNTLTKMEPNIEEFIDTSIITIKISNGIYPGIYTVDLDNLAAETAAYMSTVHPDYAILAARIAISNLQKQTSDSFSKTIEICHNYINSQTKLHSPLIADDVYEIIQKNKDILDKAINYTRDFGYDYFGFKTLEKSYLFKIDGVIVERPQHMLMRVAIGIHKNDIKSALETYEFISLKYFTHATPTLFNAGTPNPQMSSCFLLSMKEDSIDGIYDTLKRCALISKSAGGIGMSVHQIRASKSYIRGTNGTSNGLVPMLRVFNDTARYVDQGGGKRKGAFAIYLEPWHYDVFEFLDLRKNTGKEEQRARDLFFALWIPDLFMKRVEEDGDWNLFCPNEAPGLNTNWGATFEDLYVKYEKTPNLSRRTLKARELWFAILLAQIETGNPYILYKDACNRKSNHQHLGTIQSSNLCVKGNTKILTDKGYIEIGDHVDEELNVWNGFEFSQVKIKKTGTDQKLVRISFSNGAYLDCTPYHKFYIVKKDNKSQIDHKTFLQSSEYTDIIEAQNLKVGMKLVKHNLPIIEEKNDEFITVKSIQDLEGTHDTYCFNEPKLHAGIFNGVLTGNCTEIVEFTSEDEVAVCNLASIALPKFVKVLDNGDKEFDHEFLFNIVAMCTRNLNKIIDENYYPLPEGLADLFIILRLPFESKEARKLNREIFETIYFAALTTSMEIAKVDGYYESYPGSPVSKGILQFDMWEVKPSDRWDWNELRKQIQQYGARNSLLVAPMPTASTSQILGNNEAFEPYTSNIYTRRVLSGEFTIINRHLINDLMKINLWTPEIKNKIIAHNGSIQNIPEISKELKNIYKTVWEISMRSVIDLAADRGAFIDQSQSMNCFVQKPDLQILTSMHFYGWKKGLKTGMYYLRTRPAADAIKFTIDQNLLPTNENSINFQQIESNKFDGPACAMGGECIPCGS